MQPLFDRLRSPLLRQLVQYWLAHRIDAEQVTRRGAISPAEFPALLPHIFLYDFHAAQRGFTLRLAGEEIRRLLPNAKLGTPLEKIMPPEYLAPVRERYLRVCEEPAIMHAVGRVFINLGGTGIGERVLLPLSDAEGRVHQMIGATIYQLPHLQGESGVFSREEIDTAFFPL